MRKIRSKLTYPHVVSTLCLFLILGGGAYAATRLPKNSVGTRQIKANAVNGSKVKNGSLTGADLSGPVGDASHANNADHASSADAATNASHAGNADLLAGSGPGAFQGQGSDPPTPATLNDGSFENLEPPHAGCWWSNLSGYRSAAYYRDQDGAVHIQGVVQANDGSPYSCGTFGGYDPTVFVLPAGYRPEARAAFPIVSNNKFARLNVDPDGKVSIEPGVPTFADVKSSVTLDGVDFRCAPSGENGCP